jgi:cysteine desulfurase
MSIFSPQNVYLDSASLMFTNKRVLKKMNFLSNKILGNPASHHSYGLPAKKILEDSRKNIAQTIGAHSDEIIFTSSGSESVSLAIMGSVYGYTGESIPHIITSSIEHTSVLNTCKILVENNLAEVTYIDPIDMTGLIPIPEIIKNIKDNTILISINIVNNELGIVQDIPDLIKKVDKIKEEKYKITKMRFSSGSFYPYIHVDACQAYAHLDIKHLVLSGIDMVTWKSSKIGGPSGIAALYKKRDAKIKQIYGGGDQEFNLRGGTQSPILAYGFAEACLLVQKEKQINKEKYEELKKYFLNKLKELSKDENFPFFENSTELSIPSIISISFPYFTGQQFAIELDARGVAVSSKSACNNESDSESGIIEKLRKLEKTGLVDNHKSELLGTIRISFSPDTKKSHINKLLKEIKSIVQTYRTVLY